MVTVHAPTAGEINVEAIQPPEFLVPAEAKLLAQKLRYLRDDLKLAYPKLPTPSSWMIHCLALQYLKHQVAGDTYNQSSSLQQRLTDFLYTIKSVSSGQSDTLPLVEADSQTPLFPNTEEYTVEQLHTFTELALGYIGTGV